jgi:hypothetical protein
MADPELSPWLRDDLAREARRFEGSARWIEAIDYRGKGSLLAARLRLAASTIKARVASA